MAELISTVELAGILDRPNLRLFDCTTYLEPAPAGSDVPYIAVPGDQTFEAGHIPGADFLDLQGEFSDSGHRASLHDARYRAARGGVRPPRRRRRQPRRALFDRHADVGDAVLVDAEIARLRQCRRARWRLRQMEGGGARRSRPGAAKGYPQATFTAKPRPGFFVGKDEVLAAISDRSAVVVNALGPQFHRGLEPSRYGRPGRIPGSGNVSAATLLDPATRVFVPLADAEAKFATQGLRKDKRVIAYCGGGISATIDLFLLHRLGYDNLTLYDGSMGEWAKDESLPIETD